MTEEVNNTVTCKWTMEEREKMLTTGTLEQQREAFKDDEELMRETSKFVSEVIQTAITEASKRKVLTEKAASEGSRLKGIGSVAGWNHRARGFCSRILNALCPCFTSNELFTWTPYRYRFTRP